MPYRIGIALLLGLFLGVSSHAEKQIRPGLIYQSQSALQLGFPVYLYVIKVSPQEALIVGMGWGNPSSAAGQSDTKKYMGLDVAKGADADATQLRTLLFSTQYLNLDPQNAAVSFLVPHAHFDHFNAELPAALERLGIKVKSIFLHRKDAYLLCDQYYCGMPPASNPQYASAPYSPSIQSLRPYLDWYGSSQDDCLTDAIEFPYAGGGKIRVRLMSVRSQGKRWQVGKDYHTEGAVNIFIDAEKLILVGARPQESNCAQTKDYFPSQYRTYCQHNYLCTGNGYPPPAP